MIAIEKYVETTDSEMEDLLPSKYYSQLNQHCQHCGGRRTSSPRLKGAAKWKRDSVEHGIQGNPQRLLGKIDTCAWRHIREAPTSMDRPPYLLAPLAACYESATIHGAACIGQLTSMLP